MTDQIWRHRKTGNFYVRSPMRVVDTTNAQDGTEMVIYMRAVCLCGKPTNIGYGDVYVRTLSEFLHKFEQDKQVRA